MKVTMQIKLNPTKMDFDEKIFQIHLRIIRDGISHIRELNINEEDKKKLKACIDEINLLLTG